MQSKILFTFLLIIVLGFTATAQKSKRNQAAKKDSVETWAEFPGGTDGLMKYVNGQKNYASEQDREKGIGMVFLSFVVNTDGSIGDTVNVLKSPSEFYSREAIRIIKAMPKWTPATMNGKPVRSKFNMPIKF